MEYVKVFVTGGLICLIAQLLIDKLKMVPARVVVLYVVVGAFLTGIGIYDYVVDFGGAGATVPLIGFGYSLAKGVMEEVQEVGLVGVVGGGLKATASGISAAMVFGYFASIFFNPKAK